MLLLSVQITKVINACFLCTDFFMRSTKFVSWTFLDIMKDNAYLYIYVLNTRVIFRQIVIKANSPLGTD